MKLLKMKIKNSTAIASIILIIYILLSYISIKIYVNQVEDIDIEKIWSIFSNITVVIGVISVFFAFGEREFSKKEEIKEKISLEIDLSKELMDLEILNYNFETKLDTNSNLISMINRSVEYIIKVNMYSDEEMIDINRYLKINSSNHKKLVYILISIYEQLLKAGDKTIIEKIEKNRQHLIKEIRRLEEFDEEIKLLSQQIKYIENFDITDIIKVSLL